MVNGGSNDWSGIEGGDRNMVGKGMQLACDRFCIAVGVLRLSRKSENLYVGEHSR